MNEKRSSKVQIFKKNSVCNDQLKLIFCIKLKRFIHKIDLQSFMYLLFFFIFYIHCLSTVYTGVITLIMMMTGRFVFTRFGWGTAALITPTVLLITAGIFFSLILFGNFWEPVFKNNYLFFLLNIYIHFFLFQYLSYTLSRKYLFDKQDKIFIILKSNIVSVNKVLLLYY